MTRRRAARPDVIVSAGPCDLCGARPARVDEDPDSAGDYVTTGLCEPCLSGFDRIVRDLERAAAARQARREVAPRVAGQLELDDVDPQGRA